jgi:hypothetical protein
VFAMLGTTTDLSLEVEMLCKVPSSRNGLTGITETFIILQSIHLYMAEF